MRDLADALRDHRTRVYVDTSFLMWMSTIGSESRSQMVAWLDATCGDRLGVPVWSAHEYYRHHAEGTLARNFDEAVKLLEKTVSAVFPMAWTLLDEPISDRDPKAFQGELQDVLRGVPRTAELARVAAKNFAVHSASVISFINARALLGSSVPSLFDTIEATADARFTGRVPPGFQDRNKKPVQNGDGEGDLQLGTNKWGDLVFWKEVLTDAKRSRAKRVVLLTRDAKSDWRAGGQYPLPPNVTGDGVTPAHPFLRYEAASEAGVDDLMLVDQRRLADAASAMGAPGVQAFVYVAATPALPPPVSESERRSREVAQRLEVAATVRKSIAESDKLRFLDPASLKCTKPILMRALLASRSTEPVKPEVENVRKMLTGPGVAVAEVLTPEIAEELGAGGLVQLARMVAEDGNTAGDASAVAADLASLLPSLPPKCAGALYFGLLAQAYLDHGTNSLRAAPKSPVLQRLFALQDQQWALTAIQAITGKASSGGRLPIYMPNPLPQRLRVTLGAHGDREPPTQLRSIEVNGVELVTEIQSIAGLRLRAVFDGDKASIEAIKDRISSLYGLPYAQLDVVSDVTDSYELDDLSGLKDPAMTHEILEDDIG